MSRRIITTSSSSIPTVRTYTPSTVVVHSSPGYYGYTTYVSGGTHVSA